jgi:hypothetical protein
MTLKNAQNEKKPTKFTGTKDVKEKLSPLGKYLVRHSFSKVYLRKGVHYLCGDNTTVFTALKLHGSFEHNGFK